MKLRFRRLDDAEINAREINELPYFVVYDTSQPNNKSKVVLEYQQTAERGFESPPWTEVEIEP
jgi:hypothetical protein